MKSVAAVLILTASISSAAFAGGAGETAPKAAEKPKLVYLTSINVDTEKYDVNDNPYLKYIEEKNGVDIEIINEASDTQYVQKVSAIFASGDLPDYFLVNSLVRPNYFLWANDNMLAPLDSYIKNTKYLQKDTLPLSWELSKVNGKIYGIPMQRYDSSPRMTFARKDWMEKLNIKPESVKSIEDWYRLLKAFAENDPDGNGKKDTYGISGRSSDEWSLYIFLDAFNAGKAKVVDGKVLPNYVLPEYKEWLKFMNRLYKEGIMDPEYVVNTKQQMWEKIASGRIGAFYHFWSIQEYSGLKGKREALVAMTPPLHPDGSAGGNLNQLPVRHWIAVSKTAKNPGKVVELMDWALSEEGGNFVHAGLQGMDYEVKDGKIEIKPDRKGKNWAWRFITLGIQKTKMDDSLQHLLKQSWGDLGIQHLQHSAKYGVYDELPMLAPLFPELADYDLQSQRDEFRDKAIIGSIDIDKEWDGFVAKWKKSGGDEWIRLYTQWYNARK